MEPTVEESKDIHTLSDAAEWAGLNGSIAEPESARGSWFNLLGFDGAEPVRQAAMLSEDDWRSILGSWKVKGNPPLPAQLAQAGLLGRAVRVLAGVQPRAEVAAAHAAKVLEREREKAKSKPGASSTATVLTADTSVELAAVIDQTAKGSAPKLSPQQVEAAYAQYETRLGGTPPDDQDPTQDQLAGLYYLTCVAN